MEHLKQAVSSAISSYAGQGWAFNTRLFAIIDHERCVYAVVGVSAPKRGDYEGIMVLTRILDSRVIVEVDNTDRPLEDVLQEHGIPADKIILAHRGDAVPEEIPDYVIG